MDAIKGALLSRTMWFNWIVTALGVADWAGAHAPLLSALVPGIGPVLVVVGAVGTVLRALTSSSLSAKVQ